LRFKDTEAVQNDDSNLHSRSSSTSYEALKDKLKALEDRKSVQENDEFEQWKEDLIKNSKANSDE
jgi:hypothetical protein